MSHGLFLNKKRIDLDKTSIVRKIRIADVFNVSERKSSFSYTVKLPRTANNIRVLDMLGVEGNTSRKPYEKIRADYIVDNVNIVQNGYAVVRSEKFEINIFDGIISLGVLFGDKLISDLPLDDLNHELTVSNYVGSFSNEGGFIYANADFGRGAGEFKGFNEVVVPVPLSEVLAINIEKQAPSVFVHTLFRRLFESNGLNLIGGFFNEDKDYLKELITPSLGYEVDLFGLENEKIARFRSGKNKGSFELSYDYVGVNSLFELKEKESNGDFEVDVNGDLKVNKTGSYRIDYSVGLERSVKGVQSSLTILVNGSFYRAFNLSDDLTEERVDISLIEGDVVKFQYLNYRGGDFEEQEEGGDDYEYTAIIDFDVNVQGGKQIIKPVDYLPEMKQLDFFKDIVERYGLILHPISGSENFEFRQIESVLKDKKNAEDWTDKLTYKKSESYSSGYAKKNNGIYQYDDDDENLDQNGFFEVDDENASAEDNVIESGFKIPLKSEYNEDIDVYYLPIWKDEKEVKINILQEYQPLEVLQDATLVLSSERIDPDGGLSPNSYFEGGLVSKAGHIVKKYRVSDLLGGAINYATGKIDNYFDPVSFQVDADGIIRTYYSSSEDDRWEKENYFANSVVGQNTVDYFNTEFVYLLGDVDFEPNIYWANGVSRNTVENDEVDASVMSLKKVRKTILIRKFDTGVYTSFTGLVPELSLDNISMQYLMDKNYPSFALLMNDFKKRILEVNLSTNDIYNLNFFRLKYFKQLGKYVYLNSVTHRKGKDSEIEVLEINKFL